MFFCSLLSVFSVNEVLKNFKNFFRFLKSCKKIFVENKIERKLYTKEIKYLQKKYCSNKIYERNM